MESTLRSPETESAPIEASEIGAVLDLLTDYEQGHAEDCNWRMAEVRERLHELAARAEAGSR